MEKKNEMLVFGDNLKKIRKDNKISKQKMAKRIGVGVKSLTLLENGIIPPRLGTCLLIKIHKEFNFCHRSYLYRLKKKEPRNNPGSFV